MPLCPVSVFVVLVLEDFSAVLGRGAQFFVNPKKLVVFGNAVAAAGSTGLDLADAGGDCQIGDGVVFGFAGAVAHHSGVAVAFGQVDRFERLGQRADLVDLDQDRVGTALFDAGGQAFGVGDEQVVADELALVAELFLSAWPSRPSHLRPDRLRC